MNNQIFLMQNNTLKKLKHGEIIKPVFKYIIDNVATQPTKHRQTNTTPTILFETEYLPFEKKNSSCQIRSSELFRPKRISYLHAKCAGDANRYEFILN